MSHPASTRRPRAQRGVAAVDYVPIVSANAFPGAPLQYPTFATVTPVATLGHQPGAAGHCP